mmetsp:Transcript_46735/g.118300  ORF Transcript_46735/g.118300 Transcript_46735/m.118300 type:complete len:222 (+) Transcript_46735:521-1186(+)
MGGRAAAGARPGPGIPMPGGGGVPRGRLLWQAPTGRWCGGELDGRSGDEVRRPGPGFRLDPGRAGAGARGARERAHRGPGRGVEPPPPAGLPPARRGPVWPGAAAPAAPADAGAGRGARGAPPGGAQPVAEPPLLAAHRAHLLQVPVGQAPRGAAAPPGPGRGGGAGLGAEACRGRGGDLPDAGGPQGLLPQAGADPGHQDGHAGAGVHAEPGPPARPDAL